MSLSKRSNIVLLVIFHLLLFTFVLPGCKEGTQNSPVSALLDMGDANKPTINLQDLGDDVAKHTLSGSVLSKNSNEKLGNITVSLFYENKLAGTTKTTSDGQFYFAKLPPGLFEITFASIDNNYEKASFIARILEDGIHSPQTIEVKLTTTNPEKIKVQTKIEGEAILAGTLTKLSSLNIELEDANGFLISTALTGTNGTFSFENLSSGTYFLKAGKASVYGETLPQRVAIRDDGVVSPKYSVISLSKKPLDNYTITGFVKTQAKEALTNLEVKIYKDSALTDIAAEPTRTTGEGKFFFENLKDPKIYYLQISKSSNTDLSSVYPVRILYDGKTSPAIAEIFVSRDETITSYALKGKIYDAYTGGPLEYATVKIADLNVAVTDRTGNFYVNDMLPGTYKIEVSKFGYETLSSSFSIQDSAKSLSLPLLHNMKTGYGSIAGRIVDESNGSGMEDKTIRLFKWFLATQSRYETIFKDGVPTDVLVSLTHYQYSPNCILTTKTSSGLASSSEDLPGSFKLTHLEPGKYLVYITASSSANVPRPTTELVGGFSWAVPDKSADTGFITEIRGLEVEPNKTTFWTNYEHEK